MQATLPEKIGDCSRFLEKGDFPYHATLYVDDQIIHCSGLVLSYWSTVLESELEIDSGILLKHFGFEGCIEAVKDCVKILHGGEITISAKNAKTILKFSLVFDIKVLRKLVLSWLKGLELTEVEELEFTLDLSIQWKKLCLVYNRKDEGDIILDLISKNCNNLSSCRHFLSLLGSSLEQSIVILDMIFNFKIHISPHELNSLHCELMRYINCETRALQVLDLIVECDDNRLKISDNLFDHLYDHICNINGERLKKIARFHQTMLTQKGEKKNNYIDSPCSSNDIEKRSYVTKEKDTKKQERVSYNTNDMGGPCNSKTVDSVIPPRNITKHNPRTGLGKLSVNKYITKFNSIQMSSFMRSRGSVPHYQRLEIFLKWFSQNGSNSENMDPDAYIQNNLNHLDIFLFPKQYITHINCHITHSMNMKGVTLVDNENSSYLRCYNFLLNKPFRRSVCTHLEGLLTLQNTDNQILFKLQNALPCYVIPNEARSDAQVEVCHWFIRYKKINKKKGAMNFLSLVTTELDEVLSIIGDFNNIIHLFVFIEYFDKNSLN